MLFAVLLAGLAFAARPDSAAADHLMCDMPVEKRPQSVSIDPDLSPAGVTRDDVLAAVRGWNDLFRRYHGFAVFVEHLGDWWEADVLLTAHGWDVTWAANGCLLGYVQRGANQTVIFLGRLDAWRNRSVLAHELGHALGFGDHGAPADYVDGHIGFKLCSLAYIGVMSYCASPQTWFLSYEVPGITLDGDMVKRYWPR